MATLALLLSLGSLTYAAPFHSQILRRSAINTSSYTIAQEQIQCYALPYGGIGFASHCLTFYTLACLGASSRPLLPWMMMRHGFFDELLAVASLLGSCGMAIYTAISCHREWQYLLIALWKLSLSITLGCTSLHRAIHLKRENKAGDEYSADTKPIYWGFTVVPGLAVGLVGLFSLVLKFWDDKNSKVQFEVQTITIVLIIAVVLCAAFHSMGLLRRSVLMALRLLGYSDTENFTPNNFLVMAYWISFMGAFYSDWILGAISGDLVGSPSGDITVLYWSYFAAKRLPLFFQ